MVSIWIAGEGQCQHWIEERASESSWTDADLLADLLVDDGVDDAPRDIPPALGRQQVLVRQITERCLQFGRAPSSTVINTVSLSLPRVERGRTDLSIVSGSL